MEIKKLCIVVPFWRRPNVSMIFWENIALQQRYMDIEVVACVSEVFNESLARNYTPHIVKHSNMPIGEKWNKGIAYSKKLEYSHLMILGSDDIFHRNMFQKYKKVKGEYAGLADATAMNMRTKLARYFRGYPKHNRHGESVGSGRILSKNVIEKADYRLFDVVNQSLDLSMTKRLKRIGIENELVKTGFTYDRIGLKTNSTISGLFGNFDRRLNRGFVAEHYSEKIAKMMWEFYG